MSKLLILLLLLLLISGCSSTQIDRPPIGELYPPMVWDKEDEKWMNEYDEYNDLWERLRLKEIPYEEPIKSKVLHELINKNDENN